MQMDPGGQVSILRSSFGRTNTIPQTLFQAQRSFADHFAVVIDSLTAAAEIDVVALVLVDVANRF